MTPLEMDIAFDTECAKMYDLDKPLTIDKEYYLNKAQLQYVIDRVNGNKYSDTDSFEQNQKVTEDLLPLLINTTITTTTPTTPFYQNSYIAVLPDNYLYNISEETTIRFYNTYSKVYEVKRQGITECNRDNYRSHVDNPFSMHVLHYNEARPLRLQESNNIILISDGNYTVSTYYLTYIRMPNQISILNNIECELFDYTHIDIVKSAVRMYLENTSDKRYQTYSIEEKR